MSLLLTEAVGKRIELLRELAPGIGRLAMLYHALPAGRINAELDAVRAATHLLNLNVVDAKIQTAADIEPAIKSLDGRVDAIYVCLDPLVYTNASLINALGIAARLPVVHSVRESALAGGLMSYGPSFPDLARRAAEMASKILRGTKPADIPVEQATKFDLIVNLKTAKDLGLSVPTALLARADEVIE